MWQLFESNWWAGWIVDFVEWLMDRWGDIWLTDWVAAVAVLFYVLHASWDLQPLRIGFLKLLLVGSKRCKLGLVHRAGALIVSWCWKICEDWSLPHRHSSLYLMVFINESILLSFPFTSGVPCLFGWSIVLMHIKWMVNKCCLCYLRIGCKQLFGKVIKFGKSVHTLNHPPS